MFDEALEALTEARDWRLKRDGRNHPDVFSIYCSLGETYLERGELDEAEGSFSAALKISEDMHDWFSKERAVILSYVSQLKERRGRLDEAHWLLKSAAQIRERVLGDSHPVYVRTLIRLAELLLWSGAVFDAVAYSEAALEKAAQVFGKGHRSYVMALSSLGGALVVAFERTRDEQRGWRAKLLLEEAIQLQRQFCIDKDTQLADALNNLGHLLLMLGEIEAAAPLHQEALSIRKAKQDEARCYESLTGLAHVALGAGNINEGLNLSLEALDLAERHFGKYHPHASNCLLNIASVLALAVKLGDFKQLATDVFLSANA